MFPPMLAASGSGSYGLFYSFLVLHVAAGLTGFGSIGLAGTYARRASQLGALADQPDLVGDQPDLVTDQPGLVTGQAAAVTDEAPLAPPAGMTTEELVRYFRRPAGLWWALLAVPWLGLGALAAEPHGGGVAQAWALGAFVLWAAAALVAATVVVPALRRVGAAMVPPAGAGEPATGAPRSGVTGDLDRFARARASRSGQVASRGAAACDVLFFLALALMIWQP